MAVQVSFGKFSCKTSVWQLCRPKCHIKRSVTQFRYTSLKNNCFTELATFLGFEISRNICTIEVDYFERHLHPVLY